jgi:hypothetical protein
MFDFFSGGVISQTPCRLQSGEDAALIGFDTEDALAYAPSGTRSARAESTEREGQPLALAGLGLPPTMTRALGILA